MSEKLNLLTAMTPALEGSELQQVNLENAMVSHLTPQW